MTNARFTGRTAVITGGASGIGLAIARRFVAEGGQVVANDIDPDRVASLQAELGPHGQAMLGDVTREGSDNDMRRPAGAAGVPGAVDPHLPPGEATPSRPTTIIDVARAAGVSKATVSLVLNGRGGELRISDATRAAEIGADDRG